MEGSKAIETIKILVIGDDETGKSSIINRLKHNTFEEDDYLIQSGEFTDLIIDRENPIKVILHESSLKRLLEMDLKGINGIIIVVAADNIKSLDLVYDWILQINDFIDVMQIPFQIAINKIDLKKSQINIKIIEQLENLLTHKSDWKKTLANMYDKNEKEMNYYKIRDLIINKKELFQSQTLKPYIEISAKDGTNCQTLLHEMISDIQNKKEHNQKGQQDDELSSKSDQKTYSLNDQKDQEDDDTSSKC